MSSKSRFHFTIKQLLLAVLCIAAAFGVWNWLFRPITFRPATNADRVYDRDRYFMIDSDDAHVRNIVVVEGVFSRNNALSAALFAVEAGKVTELSGLTVGRSPNQIGDFFWRQMRITLAMADRESAQGRITQLGSAGQSSGRGGGGAGLPHHISSLHSTTLSGSVSHGDGVVIHAEGDQPVALDEDMTIDEFALRNPGNYLVVTARFH